MQTQTQREYLDLNKVYPKTKLESETYTIERYSLTQHQVSMARISNFRNSWLVAGLQSDFEYVRLVKKAGEGRTGIMMSDTPMERNTNSAFVRKANGDVIVFGLGLGLIIIPLLSDPTVKSITVVELYQDLIDVVLPILKKHDKANKLTAVQGDAFTYAPAKGTKFDTVYFDIWISICSDNYEEQKKLTKRFSKYLNRKNPDAFSDCWLKSHYQSELRREKRSGYGW